MVVRRSDQSGHAQHVLFAFRAQVLGDAVNPAEEIDVLFHGEIVVKRELLRHVADILADLFGIFGDVEAGHLAVARRGSEQAAEHADDGGFSGAVGSQKAEDFALGYLEGNVVDGREIAEHFYQIADFEGGAVGVGGSHNVRTFPVGQTIVFCGLPLGMRIFPVKQTIVFCGLPLGMRIPPVGQTIVFCGLPLGMRIPPVGQTIVFCGLPLGMRIPPVGQTIVFCGLPLGMRIPPVGQTIVFCGLPLGMRIFPVGQTIVFCGLPKGAS